MAEDRVEAGSPLGQLAAAYGFAPFTVAARACAAFQPLVVLAALPPAEAPPLPAALGSANHFYGCHASAPAWLTATFLSCALLAAKNIDRVAFRGLPAAMLGHCAGATVLPKAAAALEVEILEALSWRLGPFLGD
ncbi:hypothetical protein WJX81_002775 [Elliptochloris bilobata]|uniref:Uncharacterized protein n=1 Tax=Elliptochloris bilobata TaxID=381761 RepID=A0AAW1RKL5_9CHLO